MSEMVRKQIYIEKRQRAQLKRAAKAHGLSQSELIRQAIDQKVAGGGKGMPRDPEAWEWAMALMRSLQAQGLFPIGGGSGRGRRSVRSVRAAMAAVLVDSNAFALAAWTG